MTGTPPATETVHASCVAIDGHATLLCGRSGSGKSDLALRLLDRGARLVSDDYTVLRREEATLLARAPETIAGKIEVRGLGILDWPAIAEAPVVLCLALDQPVARFPDEGAQMRDYLGISIPVVALDPHENSAPIKAELAVRNIVGASHNKDS